MEENKKNGREWPDICLLYYKVMESQNHSLYFQIFIGFCNNQFLRALASVSILVKVSNCWYFYWTSSIIVLLYKEFTRTPVSLALSLDSFTFFPFSFPFSPFFALPPLLNFDKLQHLQKQLWKELFWQLQEGDCTNDPKQEA